MKIIVKQIPTSREGLSLRKGRPSFPQPKVLGELTGSQEEIIEKMINVITNGNYKKQRMHFSFSEDTSEEEMTSLFEDFADRAIREDILNEHCIDSDNQPYRVGIGAKIFDPNRNKDINTSYRIERIETGYLYSNPTETVKGINPTVFSPKTKEKLPLPDFYNADKTGQAWAVDPVEPYPYKSKTKTPRP
ncbi:MAG: hypothetical protein N4A43_02265 [Alphaproteobacteria bacterium]|jgi:hypothetical protein|nr:hypothetical protein [Alphaproteobacteria bacterium]